MAMSVNDIYQWVYTVAQNYQSGQWSDDQFNLALKVVNVELLRSEIGLPESYSPGNPDPAIAWQVSNVISDDLRYFLKSVNINQASDGFFKYPDDYAGYSSIWYELKMNPTIPHGTATSKSRYVEVVSDDQLKVRLTSVINPPTFMFPITVWYDKGFQVYPAGIKRIELAYLRYPVTPVWGFDTLPNGQTQYNAGLSVQPEWPDTMIPNFAMRICKYLSINIREEQLYAYMDKRIKEGA